MKYIENIIKIVLAAAALALLFLLGLNKSTYLLFHSITEMFGVCIALAVFFLTWNSRSYIKNNYLIVVGIACLFIGSIDFFHALSYKGMGIFADNDDYATRLWIAARYFESLVLLVSFLLIKSKKRVDAFRLFILYTVITSLVLLSIFVWKTFPACLIEGAGLTPFKKISEYIICAILLAALLVLRKNKSAFNDRVYRFLTVFVLSTIISELCFTTYTDPYGFANLLGHYFKIIAFYFVYRAVIHTGMQEPYNLIFKELKQTEHQLYEQNQILSDKSIADGLTIKEHIELQQQQYKVLNRQGKMLDLSNEAIFAWELDGGILFWNKGAELMYGYSPEEAAGRISDELLKTERLISREELRRLLLKRGTWVGEILHTTKDGRKLSIDATHQLYSDEDGRKIVLEISRDVTERNKLEADIRYRNMLLYAVIENMHDALIVYDREGGITSINARAREMYPVTDNTTVFNIFKDYRCYDLERNLIPFEDFPTRRAFRGENISNERVILENGSWSRIIEINATPIVDGQGNIQAIVVCHHDITELIKKQNAIEEHIVQLQQQNRLLNRQAKLLDLSNEAIFSWYMDGPIIYWNQGAEKMYGFRDDEAVGCSPLTLLNSRFPVGYEVIKSELLERGVWSGIVEHTTADGRQLCIEKRLQVIINELGLNTILETDRDLTDRIKAENEVRKNAEELNNIINSTDDFIWSVDTDGRIILCNESIRRFVMKWFGLEFKPGVSFRDDLPAEASGVFLELYERVKQEGEVQIDLRSRRGDRIISYSLHPINIDSELVGITVFGRDITDRLLAEQEIIKLNTSLEARVAERTNELNQSLETLRSFSMTVTHDLKMPLQEICRHTGLIRDGIDIKANSAAIMDMCDGMNAMLAELLDYERITRAEPKKEAVDMGQMILSVYEELKTEKSVLDFQTGMPTVFADKVLMRHVIMNLISNAVKFSSGRAKPTIVAGCRRENDEFVFSIKDNGIGVDMEYAGKLFSAFERLHNADEYEGHGIGLAAVRNIIAKHGGRTWLNGKVNIGTTVYFTLPVFSEEES